MLSLFAAVLIQATNGVPFTAALDQVAAERARDQKADIVLEIGVKGFALLKPIYIDRELQPTGAGKLTVRGAKGMRPRIFGSVPVKNWKRVGKKMNGRSDVWVADVSELDPVDQLDALFLDGAMMTLARYPNFNPKMPYSGGWAYVPGRWVSMYQFPKPEPAGGRTEMRVGKKDWHNWAVPSEGRNFWGQTPRNPCFSGHRRGLSPRVSSPLTKPSPASASPSPRIVNKIGCGTSLSTRLALSSGSDILIPWHEATSTAVAGG